MCWCVQMIRAAHQPRHHSGKLTKTHIYSHELRVTNGRLPPSVPSANLHPNKRKQSRDCSQFNTRHHVHGQNHANTHLFRVSGIEWKQDGGKQWLNVFVAESQKPGAAYLHSQDRSSSLNGGSHLAVEKAGATVARPPRTKALLLRLTLSLQTQIWTYFTPPPPQDCFKLLLSIIKQQQQKSLWG